MDDRLLDRMDAQEQRVRSLEGQLRRWQRVTLTGLLGAASLLCMGQATPAEAPGVITCQALRIVDEQGRVRANFTARGNEVYLAMGEVDGKTRIQLSVKDKGDADLTMAGSGQQVGCEATCHTGGSMEKTNW